MTGPRRSSAGAGHSDPVGRRVRRRLEDPLARPARPRLVLAQHVLELDDMAGRLDVVQLELLDLLDVVEDPRQLRGHLLDLVLGQPQARKLGDVQYLVAADHRTTSSNVFVADCPPAVTVILTT